MTGYIVIGLIMLLPAIFGGILARNRGRSILVWAVLSAIFPIFLMVVYFEKPLRDVPGGFKRCTACREFNPWKATVCKYCSVEFPSLP
ncbi:MAG TPA: hypothetical protein VK187_12885 [Geobacteraceae bacterium]|nr:hypothetical protein [Geobacteraceae bacterium]